MEAYVHMTGYVGGDVEFRNNTLPTASFRVASTPRIRRSGDWADGETTWMTITCFRALAEHAASSVRKGDPVIVIGKLRTSVWVKDGVEKERTVLEAQTIGHDLTRGTSAFNRSERPQVPEERDQELAEVIASVERQADLGEEDGDDESQRSSRAA